MDLGDMFPDKLPIIAPVVLMALPGSPQYAGDIDAIVEKAVKDARLLESCGVDGLSLENMNDAPFFASEAPPETVASMGRVLGEIRRGTSLPIGVNVLRNCARAALAIADTFNGNFIRVNVLTEAYVTDQGIIEGPAAELMRVRRLIGAERIPVFADVDVKHAVPLLPRPLHESALDLIERGMADALIVSGRRTGSPALAEDLRQVRSVGTTLIGSGLTVENVDELLPEADGAIVASTFRQDGNVYNAIEPERVRRFMAAVHRLRS